MLLRLAFLCCFLLPNQGLLAADLFGNEILKPGELSIHDQQELYQQFFGEFDSNANNSGKRLNLATHLQSSYADDKFAPLRRYLLKRIEELCDGQKKYEAYTALVFVFIEQHKEQDPTHTSNAQLIELLTKQYSKAPRDEREPIVTEITAFCNQNAKQSLSEKNFDRASDDYKTLASWLGKTRDKDGASLAKDMIKHIKYYVSEQEDMLALETTLKEDNSDATDNASLGRFYFKEHEWEKAHNYLVNGQQNLLAEIASIAQQEDLDSNKQGQCAVAIGKALADRENKKDIPIRRTLLELGVAYKATLDSQQEALSPAMKIKYTLVSESWQRELDEIGPDPLKGFEVAGAGASVDESRLIRMGWVPIFDHKNVSIARDTFINTAAASIEVINGILVIKQNGPDNNNHDNIRNVEDYKSFKIRFKFASAGQSARFTFNSTNNWDGDLMRITIRRGHAGFSQKYGSEFGQQNINTDDWNDLTITLDGQFMSASLNGVDYERKKDFTHKFLQEVQIKTAGAKEPVELHIQSFLGLPHNK